MEMEKSTSTMLALLGGGSLVQVTRDEVRASADNEADQ